MKGLTLSYNVIYPQIRTGNVSVLKMSVSYPHVSQKIIWLHTYLTTTSISTSSTCNSVLTMCYKIQRKKTRIKQNLSFLLTATEFINTHTGIPEANKEQKFTGKTYWHHSMLCLFSSPSLPCAGIMPRLLQQPQLCKTLFPPMSPPER